MDPDPICGGCLCGSVRYEATGQPYTITHCHYRIASAAVRRSKAVWAEFGSKVVAPFLVAVATIVYLNIEPADYIGWYMD